MTKREKDIVLVLRNFRYRDNRFIIDVFSKKEGKISLGFTASKRAGSASKRILLRPPNWVEIEYLKSARFHPKITGVRPVWVYRSLHSDLRKSAVALFITEVLHHILNAPDIKLFDNLLLMFKNLDEKNFNPDFHLMFLKEITAYSGIWPGDQENGIIFAFEKIKPLTRKEKQVLQHFLRFGTTSSREERRLTLKLWLDYLAYHLEGFRYPKSLEIYNEVFDR